MKRSVPLIPLLVAVFPAVAFAQHGALSIPSGRPSVALPAPSRPAQPRPAPSPLASPASVKTADAAPGKAVREAAAPPAGVPPAGASSTVAEAPAGPAGGAKPAADFGAVNRAIGLGDKEALAWMMTEVDPNSVDEATGMPLLSFIAKVPGCEAALAALLEMGATVDAKDGKIGRTALMSACLAGNESAVPLLLDRGADLGATSDVGWDPLMHAASTGRTAIVKTLLERGANAGYRNDDGINALWLCIPALQGDDELARLLIGKGADVNAKNERLNLTVLQRVRQEKMPELEKALLDAGAKE